MLPTETDVLVVGAGPTGLALAATLQQAGIRHLLVDRLEHGQNASRAAVIHAHTLETLAPLGVAEALAARGLRLPAFSARDRDRALFTLPFDTLPAPHNYLLMIPQDETEAVLAARLAATGGQVRRGCELTGLVQDADGVRATIAAPDGTHTVRARYAVGADGMHSRVREAAGIAFEGEDDAQAFVLADVRMDWPLGRDEVSLFFSPAGLLVVAPLPDGAFRLVAPVADAPAEPGRADMQAIVAARGPVAAPGRVESVAWGSRFRIHHRLAARYSKGRLFVVGDAAHVHSPAGGQGMNCGLVDACVLGRLLADVVAGRRPETALADYERLRRPAAAQVLALAARLTRIATVPGRFARALRNLALSAAFGLPPVRRKLMLELSGLGRRHLARLPDPVRAAA